jgi:MFS transporter, ACS family, D-galactonate transporter
MLFGGTLMGRFGWRPFFLTLGLVSFLWLGPWAAWMPRGKPVIGRDNKAIPKTLEIVSQRSWLATALGLFAGNYVGYFLITWLPFYLVRERGLSMNAMAEAGGAILFAAAISAMVSGKLSDRWILAGATPTRVRKSFMVAGSLLVGAFLMAAVTASRSLSVGLLVLAGASYGLMSSNMWAITQTLAGPRVTGRWAGSQNFIGNLSGAIGPALSGFLVDRTASFLWPFLIAGLVAWGGAAVWASLLGPIEPVRWSDELEPSTFDSLALSPAAATLLPSPTLLTDE